MSGAAGSRVLLILSGGGAKAAAHVGALRALAEAGLWPTHIVGTSMGAVMGACHGAGLTPEQMLERIERVGRTGVVRSWYAPWGGLWLGALLQGPPLRRAVEMLVPARAFEELAVPLTVTVVDVETGELVRLGANGRPVPLVDALWASCALPVYYPPVSLDGRLYADGGLRGVLPLLGAEGIGADLAVAVDIGPGFEDPEVAGAPARPPLILQHDRATGALMAEVTRAQVALWRASPERPPLLYVRPAVERHATFRTDRVNVYADEGYRATKAALAGRQASART
jgi:NTE family protein